MSAGWDHTCATTASNVVCWGGAYSMKLGNGKSGYYVSASPTAVP